MAISTWVQDELIRQGVPYRQRHHDDAYTAQQVAQNEHISGRQVAKVVAIMADGRPVELVMPGNRRVALDWVQQILGANQVRLATETELGQCFADCELGAIPALRHWRGVDVIVDGHLVTDDDIMILGGTHRDAVLLQFDDWFEMVQPRVELLCDIDQ